MPIDLVDGVRVAVRQPEPPRWEVRQPVLPRQTIQPPAPTRAVVVPVRGPAGPVGGSYAHHQASPAATWVIVHNLGTKPPVVLLPDDSPTRPVFTDVTYPDDDTISIEWPAATSGWAYL